MFQKARLKLTAWYLLIIMAISLAFSAAAYNRFHRELGRLELIPDRFERRVLIVPDPVIFVEIRTRLLQTLALINLAILVISGGLGYWLAGKTLEPIKNMVEEQNRFVSDASHELKTPLTSLKTAFEVYLRSKKLPPAKQLVKESLDEVNKLQKLTEGLLVLSRGQSVEMNPIKLQTAIDAAGRRLKPIAEEKKIRIIVPKTSLKIRGDGDQLTDLLVILLDNAVKYSSQKSQVKITAVKTDGKVILSVIDHGMGISAKDLPYIFDRFYRADSARTKNGGGGYGLGLAIAKKIVDVHRGSIRVKSRLGQGTVFQLTFSLIS